MEHRNDDVTTADLAETTRARSDGDDRDEREGDEAQLAEHERDEAQLAEPESAADEEDERSPLLPQQEAAEFQNRWSDLQTSFVDEPRRSVQEGDTLVAELMQRLANSFAEEREALEAQWDRGDDVSTEDLRVALQRYRSFFDRLLSA
jgi:hypothetical protein